MQLNNKNYINYRPVTVFAISLILGIGTKALNNGFLIVVFLAAIFLCILAYFAIDIRKNNEEKSSIFASDRIFEKVNERQENLFEKKKKKKKEDRLNGNVIKLLSISKVVAAALIIGILAVNFQSFWYNNASSYSGLVSGRVKEIDYKNNEVVLTKVSFGEKKVAGNLAINYVGDVNFDIGYKVTFDGYVTKSEIFNTFGNVNSSIIDGKIRYQTQSLKNLKYEYGEVLLSGKFEYFYKSVMKNTMDDNSYAISSALMFGDTSSLSDETNSAFQTSGIAHVFSVSGLHVGVIYLFLKKFLSGKRINKYFRLCVISLATFFYAYICGLKPSQIRAFVMCFIMLLADTLYVHNDKITTLSLAAICVALYSPLSVYTAGFSLSFVAVLSIIMFTQKIKEILIKEKIKSKKGQGVSGVIAAQIGTFPLISYYFGYIPTFSLVLNFLFVPIISFAFVYLLIFTPITFLTTVNFLRPIDIIFYLSTKILSNISTISFSCIYKRMTMFSLILYYLSFFAASDYLFIQKEKKRGLFLVLLLITLVSLFI